MKYAKIKDHSNLVRDLNSNAIINTSSIEYERYLDMKAKNDNSRNKIENIENQLFELKSDIDEIKKLLLNIKI